MTPFDALEAILAELPTGFPCPPDCKMCEALGVLHDALKQLAAEPVTDLHTAILNLPCDCGYARNTDEFAIYTGGHQDARHAAAELAAQAAPVVPPGFVLVPIEPTDDMLYAASEVCEIDYSSTGYLTEKRAFVAIFKTMLAAAPSTKDTK